MVDNVLDNPLDKLAKLSKQERKVLELRCKGLDYKAIALALGVATGSVKQYMQRIYVKLGIDLIRPAERMKTIYQVYCPLLGSSALPPGEEDDEDVVENIPPEVEQMVDEDEYLIVHVQPQPPAPPPMKPQPRKWLSCVWFGIVLVFGICLGAGVVIFAIQSNIAASLPFLPQPTSTLAPTFTPLPTETTIPSATVELPTQTPIIETVVITATPLPPTPLPTATETPSVTLPFEDTFDLRARPEWQASTGTWRVVDGHFTAENEGDWQIAFVGDPNWHNYKIEVTTFLDYYGSQIRIITRAGKDGYIAFEFASYYGRWLLVSGESRKEIANVDVSLNVDRAYNLTLEVKDDIYTAYINDIQYLQVQDTTYSTGKVGVGYDSSYFIWFDDFKVTELP